MPQAKSIHNKVHEIPVQRWLTLTWGVFGSTPNQSHMNLGSRNLRHWRPSYNLTPKLQQKLHTVVSIVTVGFQEQSASVQSSLGTADWIGMMACWSYQRSGFRITDFSRKCMLELNWSCSPCKQTEYFWLCSLIQWDTTAHFTVSKAVFIVFVVLSSQTVS